MVRRKKFCYLWKKFRKHCSIDSNTKKSPLRPSSQCLIRFLLWRNAIELFVVLQQIATFFEKQSNNNDCGNYTTLWKQHHIFTRKSFFVNSKWKGLFFLDSIGFERVVWPNFQSLYFFFDILDLFGFCLYTNDPPICVGQQCSRVLFRSPNFEKRNKIVFHLCLVLQSLGFIITLILSLNLILAQNISILKDL